MKQVCNILYASGSKYEKHRKIVGKPNLTFREATLCEHFEALRWFQQ